MLALRYIICIQTHAHTHRACSCTYGKQQMWSSHHFEVEQNKKKMKKKKIVFRTISNRSESHSLHCINPKSGFLMLLRVLHTHVWALFSILFNLTFFLAHLLLIHIIYFFIVIVVTLHFLCIDFVPLLLLLFLFSVVVFFL